MTPRRRSDEASAPSTTRIRRSLLLKQLIRRADQVAVGMLGAVLAELLGLDDEGGGIDHRRLVLLFVIAVEPGQDDADILLARRQKLLATPGR